MDHRDKRSLILFFILTFTISWLIWIISGVLTREGDFLYDYQWLFAQVGVFAPSFVAIVLIGIQSKEFRNICLRIFLLFLLIFIVGLIVANNKPNTIKYIPTLVSIVVIVTALMTIIFFSYFKQFYQSPINRGIKIRIEVKWIFSALFFFPTLFLIGWLVINFQEGGLILTVVQNDFSEFLQVLILVFSMNLILGGSAGEELGWRGYALPLLLKKFDPLTASLILGAIWAFWHFPIDITSTSTIGPFVFIHRIIWTLPITIIFTWFYIKTNGSLLIAILLHTSINVLPDLGFQNYETSIIFMTLLLVVAALFISFRPEMRSVQKESDKIQ